MKKLNLEQLNVESFITSRINTSIGTVAAHSGYEFEDGATRLGFPCDPSADTGPYQCTTGCTGVNDPNCTNGCTVFSLPKEASCQAVC